MQGRESADLYDAVGISESVDHGDLSFVTLICMLEIMRGDAKTWLILERRPFSFYSVCIYPVFSDNPVCQTAMSQCPGDDSSSFRNVLMA